MDNTPQSTPRTPLRQTVLRISIGILFVLLVVELIHKPPYQWINHQQITPQIVNHVQLYSQSDMALYRHYQFENHKLLTIEKQARQLKSPQLIDRANTHILSQQSITNNINHKWYERKNDLNQIIALKLSLQMTGNALSIVLGLIIGGIGCLILMALIERLIHL